MHDSKCFSQISVCPSAGCNNFIHAQTPCCGHYRQVQKVWQRKVKAKPLPLTHTALFSPIQN